MEKYDNENDQQLDELKNIVATDEPDNEGPQDDTLVVNVDVSAEEAPDA